MNKSAGPDCTNNPSRILNMNVEQSYVQPLSLLLRIITISDPD